MAGPLRLEYPGALYHVTSRGDGREDVFLLDGPDREAFLELLGEVCGRFAPRGGEGRAAVRCPRLSAS